MTIFLNASCSELLRRASPASSHLHSAIFCRSNRSRPIDTFSNRPFGVKHFQTSTTATVSTSLAGSCFSSESAPRALPSWDSKTRRNNLLVGLAVSRTKRTHELTSSIVPRGTSFHCSVDLGFLLSALILNCFHAAATACSRVHRNSVPSTHIRCMITANRRARATIAFFIPRRLAICMAQALSHDHFFERIML